MLYQMLSAEAFVGPFLGLSSSLFFLFLYLPRVPLDIVFQTVFENRLRPMGCRLMSDSPNC